MPARLVYSPKAYVYTKDQQGVLHDFSSYVVSGQVQRKISQVSTAEVVLRNPYKKFTTPSTGVAFHPMDPITIYLERLQGFPVQVFTGYLDNTPYYQMFPGTITLQASCTLKRLLYTYFDPSLPYVIAFFQQYGWYNTGKGSIISQKAFDNANAATQADVNAGKQPFTALQDGSLGKLLWAILFDIGEWQDSNIYIENLPSGPNGIADRMQQLMRTMQTDSEKASLDFTTFLENVIGAGKQGNGGGTNNGGTGTTGGGNTPSGPVKGGKAIVQTVKLIAAQYNVPLEMVLAVMYIETGYTNQDSSGNPHYGWFQTQTANPPYAFGTWSHTPPTVQQAHDLGLSATAFCSAAAGLANNDPSLRNNIQQWAMSTQGVNGSNNPYYITGWPAATSSAQSLISQFGGPNAGPGLPPHMATTNQQGKTAPSKGSPGANYTGYVSPFQQGSNVSPSRTDMGVDFSGSATLVAIGNGRIYTAQDSGTGWPRYNGHDGLGGYIGYTLTDGPLKGKNVYYAENINTSVKSGNVTAGQPIATLQSGGNGMEMGWGDPSGGMGTLASALGQQRPGESQFGDPGAFATASGLNFSDFLKALGAPGGTGGTHGNAPNQTMPAGYFGGGITGGVTTGGGTGGTGAGGTGGVTGNTSAQAFVAELQFPSVTDQVTATALGAEHKGLMHDQALMPFVQQVAQASMRSFQSLPNGDFFAFYPDYFGEMGHHKPYWMIRDIEILNGGINLSDDALATHVFAVGDNSWPINDERINMLFSAGTITVFNAFLGNLVDTSNPKAKTKPKKGDMATLMTADEAVQFIKRYGARPLVQDYPMVRSPIFEMLLAYQQFMFAWSNQFKTPFAFTFMPELFPGGKVGFPDHGIQMYINSVTHEWNYEEGGFTTSAELSAPSLLDGVNAADFPDIPPNMVAGLIEPIRKGSPGTAAQNQSVRQAAQQTASAVDQGIEQIFGSVESLLGLTPGISPGGLASPH